MPATPTCTFTVTITNNATVSNDLLTLHGYATHHTAPHIPHEGFLADFLMRNKGFIGG